MNACISGTYYECMHITVYSERWWTHEISKDLPLYGYFIATVGGTIVHSINSDLSKHLNGWPMVVSLETEVFHIKQQCVGLTALL